jgi:hypothetical protein
VVEREEERREQKYQIAAEAVCQGDRDAGIPADRPNERRLTIVKPAK